MGSSCRVWLPGWLPAAGEYRSGVESCGLPAGRGRRHFGEPGGGSSGPRRLWWLPFSRGSRSYARIYSRDLDGRHACVWVEVRGNSETPHQTPLHRRLLGSGWLAAKPQATPQVCRPLPWGFLAVSSSHPKISGHDGIRRTTVEFSENSQKTPARCSVDLHRLTITE